ncbi:MAG TPA: hypothetical protein VGH29_14410 [Candidatus Binataceae bacterium]|jgi:hypothetical protein
MLPTLETTKNAIALKAIFILIGLILLTNAFDKPPALPGKRRCRQFLQPSSTSIADACCAPPEVRGASHEAGFPS